MTSADGTQFTTPDTVRTEVLNRYERYVREHHGDVSDILHLCEVMFNSGERNMAEVMREFSGVLPQIWRLITTLTHVAEIIEGCRDHE